MIDSAYFVVGRWHRKYHHDYDNAIVVALNVCPNDPLACSGVVCFDVDGFGFDGGVDPWFSCVVDL